MSKAGQKFLKVICIVLPTGETLWIDNPVDEHVRGVLDKWKSEHPEFIGTPCTSGAVILTMPEEAYLKLPEESRVGV